MNGSEHYREAERLLAGQPKTAADRELGIVSDEPWPPTQMELLEAQVHATLALAAATALPSYRSSNAEPTFFQEDWRRVATEATP